jgi:hypothetical protein
MILLPGSLELCFVSTSHIFHSPVLGIIIIIIIIITIISYHFLRCIYCYISTEGQQLNSVVGRLVVEVSKAATG